MSLINSGRTPVFSRTEVSPIDGTAYASPQVNILIPGTESEQTQVFEVDLEEGRKIIELRDQIELLTSSQEITHEN